MKRLGEVAVMVAVDSQRTEGVLKNPGIDGTRAYIWGVTNGYKDLRSTRATEPLEGKNE